MTNLIIAILTGAALFALSFITTGIEVQAPTNTPDDYAQVPYADEYQFVYDGDTVTVVDASTGEIVAKESRYVMNELLSEDGSFGDEDYYQTNRRN